MQKATKFFALFLLFNIGNLFAQNKIFQRIIFIGDAGEINEQQQLVLKNAEQAIIPNKTIVFYLGDNIYPKGMGLPGSKERNKTEHILASQYQPMLAKNASVYFIPGNHDWDKMGKKGLAKVTEQAHFINNQNNPLLHFVPENGCPGPIEIPIDDKLVLITFDSEWWLFPHNKTNEDCECTTKEEFIEKIEELAGKNKDKMVLLVAHHPMQSYGVHSGHFSFKDHLFPLTNVNKNLYVPLPVLGSLYPFLRTALPNPEDQMHPSYQQMVQQINAAFAYNKNVIHVAGHEHGLQFIKNNNNIQVVSGAGAKNTAIKKGNGSLFATKNGGFVVADQLENGEIQITYYAIDKNSMQQAFTYTVPFLKQTKLENAISTSPLMHQDSVVVKANEKLNEGGKGHRKWLGENYREEWAADTKLPVFKLSELKGGLVPTQAGGGMQTKSLRLVDPSGKEWVLRNVNKNMELLLPDALRETFAKDVVSDALSGQHPYSALLVPPIAEAAEIPHANPIIGVVAPDINLGDYAPDFIGKVVLLEEREPIGKSDNTPKLFKNLKKDNDNEVDTDEYFRARLVDVLVGDWDRHQDQWRWAVKKDKKGNRKYSAVPRDRDQVLHVVDGILPGIAAGPMVMPRLHDFDGEIKKINYFFMAGSDLNSKFLNRYDENSWNAMVNEFVATVTDSVLQAAVQALPESSQKIRGQQIYEQLKQRRDNMPQAMQTYYQFFNRIVDIQTSNKEELVSITTVGNQLKIQINKISKKGNTDQVLFERVFDPAVTKEIRLFVHKGDDVVQVDNTTPIRLRIVGQKGNKTYNIVNSQKKVRIYGKKEGVTFTGATNRVIKHLKNDSITTAYLPTNLYNRARILPAVGFNKDDGLLIGAGIKFINQGFRKAPYANSQEFYFKHSFATNAYHFGFNSEWIQALGSADILFNAQVMAPNNTQNYFGWGNGTNYNKNESDISYYRSRFSILEAKPEIRWRKSDRAAFSVSPFFQYYSYNPDKNDGRLISNPNLVGTYDADFVDKTKLYAGLSLKYLIDARDNVILPTNGGLFQIEIGGYKGLNSYAKDFIQAKAEVSINKKLDPASVFVISNRLGGGVTLGDVPFYNALFLGGQGNLMGFRQFRFAGENMLYNNFQTRIRLAHLNNYILPGELGVLGFFDAGKVWAKNYNSSQIHTGVGGGVYFVPLDMFVLKVQAGYSKEGWYPYVTSGFKF
ncbi:metallophosphoesterase [Flavobacterium agricola]|uniref:Metallophosphoesterase n=1 Tax=Flavobacterium agricola TaxID=2870839 RepID=A0ABY6M3A9_9FLAO|nr:BamA/TamA family outer membrane protein [Flavobacterium agricola]UYW02214.1 metallophosphoesterase [Flavobacterium agricola]